MRCNFLAWVQNTWLLSGLDGQRTRGSLRPNVQPQGKGWCCEKNKQVGVSSQTGGGARTGLGLEE